MDFAVALSKTERGKDVIMVTVDQFPDMAYFIPYEKSDDASRVAPLYFKEVIKIYDIPESIVSYWDTVSLCHFWRCL